MKDAAVNILLTLRHGYRRIVRKTASFMSGDPRGSNVLARLWLMYVEFILVEALAHTWVSILPRDLISESSSKTWDFLDAGVVVEIGQGRVRYNCGVQWNSDGTRLYVYRDGSGERRWRRVRAGMRVVLFLSVLVMILAKCFGTEVILGEE